MNLATLLRRSAADHAGQVALRLDETEVGYARFAESAGRFAAFLRASGLDRIDDMIVSGGENVFPQMVEEHLAGHPDLAEVAVIGTAHERWVEQVTAVVVPNRDGVTADDVAAWCANHPDLRGIHRPRRIEVVDALPRTGSGKLNRPELRKKFP